jgi:hypothetical protein
MIYNLNKHQFILTEDDVRDELGVELTAFLGDDKQVPIFLAEASDDLYNWYYSHMLRSNVEVVEYLLATDERAKEAVFTALVAQVRRMIRSGSHLMKDKVGEFSPDDLISVSAKYPLLELQLHLLRPLSIFIPDGVVRGVNY